MSTFCEIHSRPALAVWSRATYRWSARLAVRRPAAVLSVGLLSLVMNVAVTLVEGIPAPGTHDEFSYLLAADTFAHGRLTNPTHPMWPHFETMHVLQKPAYVSKYLPGQGLALAAGKVAFDHEIVGSWLATALACSATCWMLQAWVRPYWALVGGYLIALHPTVLDWCQSYWGGALALLGGSLVLGGARRLAERLDWRPGALAGVGMSVLAVTRPYEGVVISVLSMLALAVWRARAHGLGSLVRASVVVLPPVLAPVAITAAGLAYYNERVTGNPLRLPYLIYERQYSEVPMFLTQSLPSHTVEYRNHEMSRFYESVKKDFEEKQSWGLPLMLAIPAPHVLGFYFPLANVFNCRSISELARLKCFLPLIVLQLPIFLVPGVVFGRPARSSALLLAGFSATLLLTTWKLPHYAAPVFGLAVLLTLRSLRYLRVWHVGCRPVGRAIGRTALMMCAVFALLWMVAKPLVKSLGEPDFATRRQQVVSRLEQAGGQHLIVVRYKPDHNGNLEWVYNGADIGGSPIVWARELHPDRVDALLRYFQGRRIWLLEADSPRPHLTPYPMPRTKEGNNGYRQMPDGLRGRLTFVRDWQQRKKSRPHGLIPGAARP